MEERRKALWFLYILILTGYRSWTEMNTLFVYKVYCCLNFSSSERWRSRQANHEISKNDGSKTLCSKHQYSGESIC